MKLELIVLLFLLPTLNLGAQQDWQKPIVEKRNTPEAELLYRYGDVDNLGHGWEAGYNPFSGVSTVVHTFPFKPAKTDPYGTDMILVSSGYDYTSKNGTDGYTKASKRPDNIPQKINLKWDSKGITVKKVVLQIFVDDFQTFMLKKNYQVLFDDERIPYLEVVFNSLAQSGPIGKLISIEILPQYLHFFETGHLSFLVDDPYTKNGDGFAFDFIQILINPKKNASGVVTGIVTDYSNRKPIEGALVTASNGEQTYSDKDGRFILTGISAGLAVISGVKTGYDQDNRTCDVVEKDTTKNVSILLRQRAKDFSGNMQQSLTTKGKLDIYGIQFDVNSDKLKPSSEASLKELAKLIQQNANTKLELSGHTDADGDAKTNQLLSEKRSAAVIKWLVQNNIAVTNIITKGYGATKPIASNANAEGKELNRRVEIKIIQ